MKRFNLNFIVAHGRVSDETLTVEDLKEVLFFQSQRFTLLSRKRFIIKENKNKNFCILTHSIKSTKLTENMSFKST